MVIGHDTQIACNYCPVYFITECVGQVLPSKLESFALEAMNGLTVGNAVGGACSVAVNCRLVMAMACIMSRGLHTL